MRSKNLEKLLPAHADEFHPVVPFEKRDKLLLLDFTENNQELNAETLRNTNLFIQYINSKLDAAGAKYGIGGYGEHRTIYSRSEIFGPSPTVSLKVEDGAKAPSRWEGEDHSELIPIDLKKQQEKGNLSNLSFSATGGGQGAEPRRLHLGIDIWGKPHTKVMAPMDGLVHSFAFNNAFGDYGATIILTHNLEGQSFFTLYGHLSLNSIKNIQEGEHIKKGDVFAEFGIPFENGQWPPHLHFQIISDMDRSKGDYPGVCKYSERESYLSNCPDPDLILQMMQFASKQ
jgi:peptidoglycan LD-endopeptidase LytH